MSKIGLMSACALVGSLAMAGSAQASIVFSGSSGSKSATAEFDVSGSNLIVKLKNTSAADVLVPADLLTAVFFNVSGANLSLTRSSAVLGSGSVVMNGSTDPGNVVGGEWAYNFASGGFSGGGAGSRRYGISSTGLNDFGPPDRFPGTNLSGPTSPDGMQYGITSAGDNNATANGGLAGEAIIKNEVVFTLGGLPTGFDVNRIGNVLFLYGTAYGEGEFTGQVPAPSAIAVLGLGGLAAARRRR